jgi:spore germination protein YaaH
MNRQIFFDPQRKRWKRLRRILDAVAVVSTVILVLFFLNVVRNQHLPELLLPTPKRNYRAIQEQAAAINAKYLKQARRKTSRKPSEIPFNSGEGLRAAYYVDDDAGSFASLKNHVHQIDILFPVWLYVTGPDGTLQGAQTAEAPLRVYNVVDARGGVHSVDAQNKVHELITNAHEDTEIYPLIKNYNVLTQEWDQGVAAMLKAPAARKNLERQLGIFLAANPSYRGLSLDFEDLPDDAQADYHSLIEELYNQMHPRNLQLFVNQSVGADDAEFSFLAKYTDHILLMNYDQHEETGDPGPIAAQDWFENNLKRVL